MRTFEPVKGKDIQVGDHICSSFWCYDIYPTQRTTFYEVVAIHRLYVEIRVRSVGTVRYTIDGHPNWWREVTELKYDPSQQGDKDEDV